MYFSITANIQSIN